MGHYRKVFPRHNTFLAVVHVEDVWQALRNVRIAQENGADGVFLINHVHPYTHLLDAYEAVRIDFPSYWVGLNMLDLDLQQSWAHIPDNCDGLWTDNAGITDQGVSSSAKILLNSRLWMEWGGLYFGGVAFKHQEDVMDLAKVTDLAKPYMDVITTSGARTGYAPDIQKIMTMKSAAGSHPLGNASGISPENIEPYLPMVDVFLVATGVSVPHSNELDPMRTRMLADIVRKT